VQFVQWKLQEELFETELRERMNKDILQRIARTREIKRIDDTWDDKFMQKWYMYMEHC